MVTQKIIKILKNSGIGVLPTDTIYGLVGRALDKKTVERIYKVRKRNPKKPLIILISSLSDLKLFGVKPDKKTKIILKKLWPAPISVILDCPLKRFFYLHRGTNGLAFRLPAKKSLRDLLEETGPLVAPSANPEGLLPVKNIRKAKQYFGGKIDFYADGGNLESSPSTLLKIKGNKITMLRKGKIGYNLNIC